MNFETGVSDKILIVSSDIDKVNILNELLKDQYLISTTSTLIDILNTTLALKPDLILINIESDQAIHTGQSNIEKACLQLQQNKKTSLIPIISIESEFNNMNRDSLLRSGCVDYIKFPLDEVLLKSKIRKHFKNYLYLKYLESMSNI